jgi:hypothetical protein
MTHIMTKPGCIVWLRGIPLCKKNYEWTASETVAADILKWIEKGYCAMHITRKGSDLKTRYDIDPLLD